MFSIIMIRNEKAIKHIKKNILKLIVMYDASIIIKFKTKNYVENRIKLF